MKPFYSFIAAAVVLSLPVTSTALRGQVFTPNTAVTSDYSAITTGTEVLGIQAYGNNTLANGVVLDWQYSADTGSPVNWSLNGAGGSSNTGNTGLSAQFNRALSQGIAGGGGLDIQITGLTPGAVYVDQLFAAMTDTADGGNFTYADSGITTFYTTETVTDTTKGGDGASTTLEYGLGYGNPTGAYSVTDTFTAPSTGIEEITITGASNDPGHQDDLLNAFQVREIPEPSTWAMLLAGLAFLGFRIRRRSIFRA
jgi:hypothetical protein